MNHPPFPYPGSKKRYAEWIISRFPAHKTYVEVFGGGGAVLCAKPRSPIEVYNDANGDLVHFFEVLRDHPNELVSWLSDTPYSRQLYTKWVHEWQSGRRPDEAIERAGQFFYLRNTQFSGKTGQIAGFKTSASRPEARQYENRIDRLKSHTERFGGVVLENLDWTEMIEKYDSDETLFYLDPPYGDNPGIYGGEEFDHSAFFDRLALVGGDWLLSFQEIPDQLEACWNDQRESRYQMGENGDGADSDRSMTEYLIANFDPSEVPKFETHGHQQTRLGGETA